MESIMQFYVTFSKHVKNSIVALHENNVVVQSRNDGAFCIPAGDTIEAADYGHLIQESDSSWFANGFEQAVSRVISGIAHIYPRLGF